MIYHQSPYSTAGDHDIEFNGGTTVFPVPTERYTCSPDQHLSSLWLNEAVFIHLSVVTHGSAHISCLNEVHLMAVSEKFVLIGAHS